MLRLWVRRAWGVGHHDDILRKIEPRTGRILVQWPVAGFQSGVPLAAAGSIWIPSAAEELVRFDPARGRVTARIPVLYRFPLRTPGDIMKPKLEGGADGYLVEPIERVELLTTVRALLRMRQAEEAARHWQTLFEIGRAHV